MPRASARNVSRASSTWELISSRSVPVRDGRGVEHLPCQPGVDGNRHQVLLGAVMEVALEPAALGVLRGDDALT